MKNVKIILGLLTTSLLATLLNISVFAMPGNYIPTKGNLIKNGDAEIGDISNWQHDYNGFDTLYEVQNSTDYFTYTDCNQHSGNYSFISDLFIECYHNHNWQLSNYLNFTEDKPNTSEVYMYQDVDISNMNAGEQLVLRGYVTCAGSLRAIFLDADDNELLTVNAKDRCLKDDTEWKYQRADLIIPTNAKTARVCLVSEFNRFNDGYGDPYGEYTWGGFDDITLTKKEAYTYKPIKPSSLEGELVTNGTFDDNNLDGWFYEYEDFIVFHSVSKTEFFSRTDVNAHKGSYCLASDFFWNCSDHKSNSGGMYYLADDLVFESKDSDTSTVSIYQDIDLTGIESGKSLILDGYVACEGSISIVFYNNDSQIIKYDATDISKEIDGWKEQGIEVKIPKDTNIARIMLNAQYNRFADGYGNPYGEYIRSAFDDISLKIKDTAEHTEVNTDTNKTETKVDTNKTETKVNDNKTETNNKIDNVNIKKSNPMTIKVTKKTYSRKKNLKKKKSFNIGVSNAQGKVTYKLNSKAKKAKIKVSNKGKVTIPKNCKKGTYSITVTAKGNDSYNSISKVIKIIIKK